MHQRASFKVETNAMSKEIKYWLALLSISDAATPVQGIDSILFFAIQ